MSYVNEKGETVLEKSDGKVEIPEEKRDDNGCLPVIESEPYRAVCFQPSEQSCVIPNVIEQCSRLTQNSIRYKSVDLGKKFLISMEWQYFDGNSYIRAENSQSMTVEGNSTANLPRAKYTIYDQDGDEEMEVIYDRHYIRKTSSVSPITGLPETLTSYFNAQTMASPSLNLSTNISLPNTDSIGEVQDPPKPIYERIIDVEGNLLNTLLPEFTKVDTSFFIPVDGTSTVTEIEDPSYVRTGPTQTIGYISLSERNNNIGNFDIINKQIRYNYVTSSWEDL
jgi:hypothetical protein